MSALGYGEVVTTNTDGTTTMSRVGTALKIMIAIFAIIVFIFGAAGIASEMTGKEGYDELFCVASSSVLFLFSIPLYNAFRSAMPPLPPVDVLAKGAVAVHVAVMLAQVGILQAYLARYVGAATYGFLAVDLLLAPVVGFDKYASVWATLYIVLTNCKLYLVWRTAFFDPTFKAGDESLGPNGLVVGALLLLPVIQFFVITSRLRRGLDLFSAYTTNMVAVFCHTLHVIDVTALYMQGSEDQSAIVGDSQYLYLVLSIMGSVACSLYYVLLFFPSNEGGSASMSGGARLRNQQLMTRGGLFDFDGITGGGGGASAAARRRGRRGGVRDVASLGAAEGTQDEGLVHYLMWLVFFVDLPFGAIRLVSWWVHGVQLSSLFAKNVMMCVSATHLLIVHSKDANEAVATTAEEHMSESSVARERL